MDADREDFLTSYVKELREGNAAAFVGAGMSKAAGFVDWAALMAPIANLLGLGGATESDLVAIAQYYLNANANNRSKLTQLLLDQFVDLPKPTPNHQILARLPIRTFWTTNYDRLLETALEAAGKKVDSKYTKEQLATTRRGRDVVIYKMHGDIEHPEKAILTRNDYEGYHESHAPFITALAGNLVEHTFLFLGFSFTDPNLDYVLSRIRLRFSKDQRQHYWVTKRRTRAPKEPKPQFDYAKQKQHHVIEDLKRFNIKTILIDEFSEMQGVLEAVENRLRGKTVFISGSAVDYGSRGQAAVEQFLRSLAQWLVEKDFRIASGVGLGIGPAIVTGAIQQIYSTDHLNIERQLILRPFPIGIANPAQRAKTFERYRAELIADAGIAIFILGNKLDGGTVVKADGVRQEFEQAKKRRLYLIPVGAFGGIAQDLWGEVEANLATYFPTQTSKVKPLFRTLGDTSSTPNAVLTALQKLIALLSAH